MMPTSSPTTTCDVKDCADQYTSCVKNVGNDVTRICGDCFSPFFGCFKMANCPAMTIRALSDACRSLKCTASQCAGEPSATHLVEIIVEIIVPSVVGLCCCVVLIWCIAKHCNSSSSSSSSTYSNAGRNMSSFRESQPRSLREFDKSIDQAPPAVRKIEKVIVQAPIFIPTPPVVPIAAATPPSSNGSGFIDGVPQYEDLSNMRLLAESGQADVYRAFSTTRKEDVVVKVYHAKTAWYDCKTEANALIHIGKHPNVVSIYDYHEKPKPCVIMRFIDGDDLFQYLKKNGAMSSANLHSVALSIAEGLKHLHKNSFVHRDMKSPNVMLESNMTPVLIDMGLGARVRDAEAATKTNVPKGTLLWMAPEMLENAQYSAKVDVFAFGIMLWEMATGRVPYDNQLSYADIVRGKRPDLDVFPASDPLIRGVMIESWDQDPEQRPTASKCVKYLNGLESISTEPFLSSIVGFTILSSSSDKPTMRSAPSAGAQKASAPPMTGIVRAPSAPPMTGIGRAPFAPPMSTPSMPPMAPHSDDDSTSSTESSGERARRRAAKKAKKLAKKAATLTDYQKQDIV